jgi:WD40 repeat protein
MRLVLLLVPFCLAGQPTSPTIPARSFHEPDFVLHDAQHKEPQSGVQFGPNGITIQQGVGTPTTINVLAFSGDGKRLAGGKDYGRVVVWDVQTRSVLRAIETGQGIVSAVALNADGTALATGGSTDKFSIKIWNVSSGKLMKTVKLGVSPVKDLTFDPSGKWLAAVHNEGSAYVFDSATATPVLQLKKTHCIRFSKDGNTLFTGDTEGFATWNTVNWAKDHSVPRWQGFPLLIAVDAQRDRLAVSQTWNVYLYRFSTGERLNMSEPPLPKNSTQVPKFAEFGADGSFLFLTTNDRLWVWDTRTNSVCGSVVMYSSGGALSPDGRWLAGSKDDSIFSKERTDGVWVWNTEKVAAACGMAATGN